MVPLRLGSLTANPQSASRISKSSANRARRRKRDECRHSSHAAASGIASASQIGCNRVIMI
jgi:hypothetical protein